MTSPLNSDDLQRIFKKVDKNDDGLVSLEELNSLLKTTTGVEFKLKELQSLVGKTCLDIEEFLRFYESISKKNSRICGEIEEGKDGEITEDEESDLVEAFKVFDLNNDGFISGEEIQFVLEKLGLWEDNNNGRKDCGSMICMYDTNSDGKLDFGEFKNMMLLSIS